jgi:hypothetical protein
LRDKLVFNFAAYYRHKPSFEFHRIGEFLEAYF